MRGEPPDPATMLLTGQVLRVYLPSDPAHPANASVPLAGGPAVAGQLPPATYASLYPPNLANGDPPRSIPGVVCDVLIRSAGYRGQMFRLVPVAQGMGYGRNDAEPWIPEGCSSCANGGSPTVTNPALPESAARAEDLDGDFVLVGFLDGNANKPIILSGLTHPLRVEKPPVWQTAVAGVSAVPKVKVIRHRGVRIEIDNHGNVLVDATGATSGVKNLDGTEVAGLQGSITVKALKQKVRVEGLTVEIAGVPGAAAAKPVARQTDSTLAAFGALNPTWQTFVTHVAALLAAATGDPNIVAEAAAALAAGLSGTITSGNAAVKTD